MWNYLYFIVHLRMKEKTELTGPESYVYDQIRSHIENKVAKCIKIKYFSKYIFIVNKLSKSNSYKSWNVPLHVHKHVPSISIVIVSI